MDLNDWLGITRQLGVCLKQISAYFKVTLVCSNSSREITLYKMYSYRLIKVGYLSIF